MVIILTHLQDELQGRQQPGSAEASIKQNVAAKGMNRIHYFRRGHLFHPIFRTKI
jgi:hypothetical protein